MTDKYNPNDPSHLRIRHAIERGNGISNMVTRKEALASLVNAGFTLQHDEDLSQRKDARPWFAPLSGEIDYRAGAWDVVGALRMTRAGRVAMETLLKVLEAVRVAPSGTAETAKELSVGADALVEGGREGLFTPMYLMVAKKPEV